jgi:hypothetical protein
MAYSPREFPGGSDVHYHIDRKIVLATESEYKNLYSWHLKELDDAGKQIGRDQIPWEWSLYFTARNLRLRDFLQVALDDEGKPAAGNASRHIVGELTPGRFAGNELERIPRYSMLGTDRIIKDFSLEIRVTHENRPDETCEAWGGISFDSDVDFSATTEPDLVIFYLFVTPERFVHYSQMIESGAIDQVTLSLKSVPGFYSDWSPSISTYDVKVLVQGDSQEIEIPDGCDIEPPRLGTIRQANIEFLRVQEFPQFKKTDSEDSASEDEGILSKMGIQPEPADKDEKLIALLKGVRNVGWVIVGLLAFMLMRM